MAKTRENVLFLCTGNSCRSIMAEMLLNHLGSGQYQAYSAGSFPTGQVHPKSIETLNKHDIKALNPYSKSWDSFSDVDFDLVITVCDQAAGETCPVFLGKPKKLHWSIADPAKATGSNEDRNNAFEEAFNALKNRIEKELLS